MNSYSTCRVSLTLLIRSTKRFRVEYAKSLAGPWIRILEKEVADARSVTPYLMTYTVDVVFARYVKFTCTEFYGWGCALQYFAIH